MFGFEVNWVIREIQCRECITHLYYVLIGITLIYKGILMLIVGRPSYFHCVLIHLSIVWNKVCDNMQRFHIHMFHI